MFTLKANTLVNKTLLTYVFSSNLHVIKYLYEAIIGAMRAQIMLICYFNG